MTLPDNSSAESPRSLRGRGGKSPKSADLPFWVDAFLHLDPPRRPDGKVREAARWRIYPVVRALLADRINVRGDESVELNRDKLAQWAGSARADNVLTWMLRYLEGIGFLEIQRHPSKDGQQPDTFDVFTDPPENYVGPLSYAELDMEIAAGVQRSLLSEKPRNPSAKPNPTHEGLGSNPNPTHEGMEPENPSAKPNPTHEGLGSNPNPTHEGMEPENPSAKPNPTHEGSSRARISSAPSGRSGGEERPEGGEATTPAAGAAAGTSQNEDQVDWARELVRAMPWSQRLPKGRTLKPEEARQIAAAFRRAADMHHYSYEQIRDWALDRLAASTKNPVSYVLGAFADTTLDREPVAETLSLPEDSQTNVGEEKQANTADDPEHQAAGPVDLDTGRALPPWCGECNGGAPAASRRAQFRYDRDGHRCTCHPDYDPEVDATAPQVPSGQERPRRPKGRQLRHRAS